MAGLRNCWVQPYAVTPRPVWNPDIENPHDYRTDWQPVPRNLDFEGAKGVQLAEKGIESWQKRAWVDVPDLEG